MLKILHNWYKFCINIIYPLKCVVCGSFIPLEEIKSEFLCSKCLSGIKFVSEPVCKKCGKPSNAHICLECRKKHKIFFDRVFPVAVYEGVWRELIHIFKYNRSDYLDRFLAKFLVEKILGISYLKNSDLIIPIPLHWREKYNRGYNQTHLLACEVSRKTNIPILSKGLIKYKKIPSQTTLSGKERLKNVRGAFKLGNSKLLKNKGILLIDDVFTTGSTVNECARVLSEAKVKRINVITLACSSGI